MAVNTNTLRAHVCVALKGVSKDLRERFKSPDWQMRERAENEMAELIAGAMGAFEISEKPMEMAVSTVVKPD